MNEPRFCRSAPAGPSGRADHGRLLRWYPPDWRARYGDELVALMEDSLDGGRPGVKLRASMAWAGLRERGHRSGLTGDPASPADRIRSGSLLVLCGWVGFVVAGSSFAKLSEHFGLVFPTTSHAVADGAYGTVFALSAVGAVLVLCGAALALPSFLRFLRSGGWRSIRGHVLRAAAVSAAAVLFLIALVATARTLTPAQRNGGLLSHPVVGYYEVLFIVTGLLVVATLVLWTVAASAAVRRLELPRPVLSAEAALATAVTAAMVLMTAATAVWWGAVGSAAPWFLQGRRTGSMATAADPNLAVTMVMMVLSSALALYGVGRIVRSRQVLRPG